LQTREVDFELARKELAQFLGLSTDMEVQQFEVSE